MLKLVYSKFYISNDPFLTYLSMAVWLRVESGIVQWFIVSITVDIVTIPTSAFGYVNNLIVFVNIIYYTKVGEEDDQNRSKPTIDK